MTFIRSVFARVSGAASTLNESKMRAAENFVLRVVDEVAAIDDVHARSGDEQPDEAGQRSQRYKPVDDSSPWTFDDAHRALLRVMAPNTAAIPKKTSAHNLSPGDQQENSRDHGHQRREWIATPHSIASIASASSSERNGRPRTRL